MPDGHVDSASMPTLPHAARVMQVLDEFLRRRAAGEPVSEAALLAAHPDLADELRGHLEIVTHLQPGDQAIADLVAKGILECSTDTRYPAALGPYQIMSLIGRGGMGIVLRAYEPSLNRIVALKILRPDLSHDETAVARFQREARAAAALKHANIVTIHAIGQERGVHYIAMEHVDGPSLADLIRRQGPLPAELVRHVFRGLLEALRAAHEAGLIHRDIKSSNILLGSFQQSAVSGQPEQAGDVPAESSPACLRACVPACLPAIKLADFGLARMRASQTQVTVDGSVLGTPEYMSPEQARGDVDIDHRTDLYSAGVVLYEMLTGRTPFRADTPTATIRKILDEQPRDPRELDRHVDPVLASVALRLMAKEPAERPASAVKVLAALGPGAPAVWPTRRRPWRRHASIGAGLVALVVVVCVWSVLVPALRGPRITAVQKDPTDARCVLVRRGYGDFTPLKEPDPNETGEVAETALVDLDGEGRQLVVAGAAPPDGATHTLFAFAPDGTLAWTMALNADPGARIHWPDLDAAPSPYWSVRRLLAHDIDDVPGDELIVAAGEQIEYPTRISVIDPRTREIRATFWHTGVLSFVAVADDYFGPGKPAIVAAGLNNKLDGFDEPCGAQRKVTDWEKVLVVMVLDPAHMNGLGPPPADCIAHQPVMPWAYAFLDLSADEVGGQDGDASNVTVPMEQRAQWSTLGLNAPRAEPRPTGAGSIDLGVITHEGRPRTMLTLNADLTIRSAHCDDNSVAPLPLQECQRLWHPIVQRATYVNK